MQNHNEQETRQYAGFWIRLAAHMIDFIIVTVAFSIVESFLKLVTMALEDTALGGEILFQYTLTDIAEYIFVVVYFIIMTYFTGATLGKKLLKLKVISIKNDGKLKLLDVIYRETIGRYFSDMLGGLGYLTVAFNDEKKAIHDMLCDTRVVEVRTKKATTVRTVGLPVEVPVEVPTEVLSEVPETTETAVNSEAVVEEVVETSEPVADMIPKMVEEPVNYGHPQEYAQEQWRQILERDS